MLDPQPTPKFQRRHRADRTEGKRSGGSWGRKEFPEVAGIPMTSPVAQSPEQDRAPAQDPEPARGKQTVRNQAKEQATAWNQGPIQRRICGLVGRWDQAENPGRWVPVEVGVAKNREEAVAGGDKVRSLTLHKRKNACSSYIFQWTGHETSRTDCSENGARHRYNRHARLRGPFAGLRV